MSAFRAVSAKLAAEIDQELMGPTIGYTLQQLMELAGFSVAQAIAKEYPNNTHKHVFVVAGPGNNGGDGLVCARHLKLFGYNPIVYYPKRSGKVEFYKKLVNQLNYFNVPILSQDDENTWLDYLKPESTLCIVDAIFGFSYKPPMREPFSDIVAKMKEVQDITPIVSVDVPTGWDVDKGPIDKKYNIQPAILVSLTVPKPCSEHIDEKRTKHYVGGRFVSREFANKYGFEPFAYENCDQVMKL